MTAIVNTACADWLRERVRDGDIRAWARGLLVELCEIDTSLTEDLDRLRIAEQQSFEVIVAACNPHLPAGASIRRLPVDPSIAQDRSYTIPYYAGDLAMDPVAVYANRANLLIDFVPGRDEAGWLVNGHIDTVPPHIPPTTSTSHVSGRGSADDKGGVVTALLVARLVSEWTRQTGAESPSLRLLVSIDEEMGGNGSLAAVDKLPLEAGHTIVIEPSDLQPYSANRGATWFAADLKAPSQTLPGVFREVVLALTATAHHLRLQSHHPLFSAADVSFCLGILDEFGVHPSSACPRIDLVWPLPDRAFDPRELAASLAQRLAGDLSLMHSANDPEVAVRDGRLEVTVHALSGHMGSHDRDTDAIAKAAAVVDVAERHGLGLPTWKQSAMHLEGGQGFLPDRALDEIQSLISTSFRSGLNRAQQRYGVEVTGSISFDKLHNDAFASSDDAVGGPLLAAAIGRLQDSASPQLRGWKASCDARLFASRCDDVVTFGPGRLEVAHGPNETVALDHIASAAAAITLAVCS